MVHRPTTTSTWKTMKTVHRIVNRQKPKTNSHTHNYLFYFNLKWLSLFFFFSVENAFLLKCIEQTMRQWTVDWDEKTWEPVNALWTEQSKFFVYVVAYNETHKIKIKRKNKMHPKKEEKRKWSWKRAHSARVFKMMISMRKTEIECKIHSTFS